MAERFDKDALRRGAQSIPEYSGYQMSPEQKAVIDAAMPVMAANADENGRAWVVRVGNLVWEDLAIFAAQYRRGYVQSVPDTPKYSHLAVGSSFLSTSIYWACKAMS